MKKIQLFLVLLMVGIPTMEAQNYKMVLKKTDGTTHEFLVDDIVDISVEEIIPDLPLYVNVSENQMIEQATSAKAKRTKARAPIINTSTLESFYLHGNNYNYKLTKESSRWKADTERWPSNNQNQEITFYAHTAGDFYSDYIHFEVEGDAWSQYDLLVATRTTSFNASQGTVNLTFDHACAAVDFNILITNTLKNRLGYNALIVNKVELSNVAHSGNYYFANGWSDLEGAGSYTLTNGPLTVSTESQPLPCGYVFMIPQTLGDTACLDIKYSLSGSPEVKTAIIPLTGIKWDAAHKYTINIKLGTSTIQL